MGNNNVRVVRHIFDGIMFYFDVLSGFFQTLPECRRAHSAGAHSGIADKSDMLNILVSKLAFLLHGFYGVGRIIESIFRFSFVIFIHLQDKRGDRKGDQRACRYASNRGEECAFRR